MTKSRFILFYSILYNLVSLNCAALWRHLVNAQHRGWLPWTKYFFLAEQDHFLGGGGWITLYFRGIFAEHLQPLFIDIKKLFAFKSDLEHEVQTSLTLKRLDLEGFRHPGKRRRREERQHCPRAHRTTSWDLYTLAHLQDLLWGRWESDCGKGRGCEVIHQWLTEPL